MSLFDHVESGDERTLFEVEDHWLGRWYLIVADDENQAIERTRRLHFDFESVEFTPWGVERVRVRDIPRMRIVTVAWVKGFRLQPRPDAKDCPKDYLRVRCLGPLPEDGWAGPAVSEWPDYADAGEWQAIDTRKPGMCTVCALGSRWAR